VDIHEIPDDGVRGPPYSVQICDFNETETSIQLRWLQTSMFRGNSTFPMDVWIMDHVSVSYERHNGTRMELLKDSFDGMELKLVAHNVVATQNIACYLQSQ
jgi:hypothetical protein